MVSLRMADNPGDGCSSDGHKPVHDTDLVGLGSARLTCQTDERFGCSRQLTLGLQDYPRLGNYFTATSR